MFTHRAYWRWSAGVQFARLPSTMAPLAFTLLTTATTGSYRLGGVLMSVFVAAEMVCAVPVGRLLDRVGPSRGLPALLLLTAAGYGVLTLAAANGAPSAALLVLVTLLDLAGPLVPLAAMAAACVAAALLVPRRAAARDRVESGPGVPPARPGAALPWLCCAFTIGLLTSTIEVAPLPLVQCLGAPETAAPVVIAVLTGASIAGSACYAWRGKIGDPRLFLAGFVLGGLVLSADLGWPGLIASVAVIGAFGGPLVATTSVNLQRVLPKNRRSAGFSLSFTVQAAGFGLGSLAVGVLPLWLPPLLGVFAAATAGAMLVRKPARAIGTMSVTS